MKTGISYYGNRILRHVEENMEEIRRMHCTFVTRHAERIVKLAQESGRLRHMPNS